jgi:hypothetical protein
MADIDATILDAIRIPDLWQSWFKDPATWAAWRGFLKVLFGEGLDPAELALFRECTGRQQPDPAGYNEAWLICGRRSGKSFILALIACYLATFKDWRPYLVPGEAATIMIVASDRQQARVILRYCRALLTGPQVLKQMVVREVAWEIELSNGVVIAVHAASYAAVRGYTVVALLLDELAFFSTDTDAADPDEEVINAARPAMATVPGAMMLVASSPYARRGALWNAYRRYWGGDSGSLVWRASTRIMNPTIKQDFIDEQFERDPQSAAAEYGAEFRSDIASFVSREVVDAAVVPGRYELPRLRGAFYMALVDAAGGSGSDSMTLAIGHSEGELGERRVLDLVREWVPPFNPDDVTHEAAAILANYDITGIRGDRYGGEWVAERFREHGVTYEPAEKFKNDLYREFLPILNSGRAELLDHRRLVVQFCALERRTARGGRESIDHPPNGHDDLANAVAGVLTLAGIEGSFLTWMRLVSDNGR